MHTRRRFRSYIRSCSASVVGLNNAAQSATFGRCQRRGNKSTVTCRGVVQKWRILHVNELRFTSFVTVIFGIKASVTTCYTKVRLKSLSVLLTKFRSTSKSQTPEKTATCSICQRSLQEGGLFVFFLLVRIFLIGLSRTLKILINKSI